MTTTKLRLDEMERVFEDDVMVAEGFDYGGVKIPPGWALIIDCEGDLLCAVPPSSINLSGDVDPMSAM